jgi:hypothetical protein
MGIRDDLSKAMKKGEVTLMVMADFTKAFDTVHYKTLIIAKLSSLRFSKTFLRWLINGGLMKGNIWKVEILWLNNILLREEQGR